jgi:hypothetical protein
MYLAHVLDVVAAARGESREHLAAITTQNALRLFRWGDGSPHGEREVNRSEGAGVSTGARGARGSEKDILAEDSR